MYSRKYIQHCLRIILLYLAVILVQSGRAASPDIATLRKQYIEVNLGTAPSADWVADMLKSQRSDGTWPGIDYKDQGRSTWQPTKHVQWTESLAKAYYHTESSYAGNPKVKEAIVSALTHWLDKDYKCPNWWFNDIAIPRHMANIMVLMGPALPSELVTRIMSQIMPRSKIGMTGQNKVWLASNVFVQCLTSGDEETLSKAKDVILSELRVTTEEGIQPDWSFHQHGPQQQFGNYGRAFGDTITGWGEALRGTSFAMDEKLMSILRNYILEGPTWILWKGHMDISGCGRQINANCQAGKGRDTIGQLKRLNHIDPVHAATYAARLLHNETDAPNTLVGNKHYWRSDMMVHRRPNWYASVKMSSRRVIGSETCNSENMLGLHLGDGVLYVYQTATEYENIQPFWDWHRLPGTTCDQSIQKLVPGNKQCMLPTVFAGGVSDGQGGIAVLDYKRDALVARKSWFFTDNAIICLGAGISSATGGKILTSVQQSLLQDDVTLNNATVSQGTYALKAGDWVYHAGIGYQLLDGQTPTLDIATQKGDWNYIYPKAPGNPQQGEVFNLWFDHGKTPEHQTYAYIMYPGARAADMPGLTHSEIKILSNTSDLQAISVNGGEQVMAVLYKAGQFEYDMKPGTTESMQPLKPSNHPRTTQVVETDTPCLVMIDGKQIFVSDPTQKNKQLQLTINDRSIPVKLPAGGEAGRTVNVTAAEGK